MTNKINCILELLISNDFLRVWKRIRNCWATAPLHLRLATIKLILARLQMTLLSKLKDRWEQINICFKLNNFDFQQEILNIDRWISGILSVLWLRLFMFVCIYWSVCPMQICTTKVRYISSKKDKILCMASQQVKQNSS